MSTCVVCLQALKYHDPAAALLRCGHSVHGGCLHELMEHSSKCPICRREIETDIVFHWRSCQKCSNKIMAASHEEKYHTTLSLYLYLTSYRAADVSECMSKTRELSGNSRQ